MRHMRRAMTGSPARQRGMALVVALVMLVVILTLGLGALRLSTIEERMTGYAQDRQLAFQAAEAALREIEDRVESSKPAPQGACGVTANTGVSINICPAPVASDVPRWIHVVATDWADATPVGTGGAQITPVYLVEHLGNTFACDNSATALQTCSQYRITVRAGSAPRAQVTLQSVYLTD